MKNSNLILFFLVFALGITLFHPKLSQASFSLPFSTTFNCSEQDQSSSGWVDCDGLSRSGDHSTSAGHESQITSSANFSAGGGGRGHRYWIGPGTNNNSGGINFQFSAQTELYVRWYVRWQQGFDLNSGQKMLYFSSGQNVYFDLQTTSVRVVDGGQPSTASGFGWNDLSDGNGTANVSNGSWHCVEIHVRIVPGSNNDIAEWWFDGVKRLNFTNLDYGTPNFSNFGLPANQSSSSSSDFYNDTDDIAIQATGPIGCTHGIPTSNAPSAPTNLQTQ